MTDIWYVRRRRQIKGPFKPSIIARFIAAGQIRDGDELSVDRVMWEPLPEVRERFARLLPPGGASRPLPAAGRFRDPELEQAGGGIPDRPARVVMPRRAGSRREPPRLSADTGGGLGRVKQVASLTSVMALIVIAGIAFLPGPEGAGPDCEAAPGPAVNWSNCRFEGRELGQAVLSGAKLRNAHLPRARMLGVKLGEADLAFAELTGANLAYGDLRAVNAVGADLRQADLSYADLRGADLSHADLTGANLGGADLTGAKLDYAIWIDRRVCYEGSIGGCKLPVVSKRQPSGERSG